MAATYLSRDEARALAERALSFSNAEQARINVSSGSEGNEPSRSSTWSDASDTT